MQENPAVPKYQEERDQLANYLHDILVPYKEEILYLETVLLWQRPFVLVAILLKLHIFIWYGAKLLSKLPLFSFVFLFVFALGLLVAVMEFLKFDLIATARNYMRAKVQPPAPNATSLDKAEYVEPPFAFEMILSKSAEVIILGNYFLAKYVANRSSLLQVYLSVCCISLALGCLCYFIPSIAIVYTLVLLILGLPGMFYNKLIEKAHDTSKPFVRQASFHARQYLQKFAEKAASAAAAVGEQIPSAPPTQPPPVPQQHNSHHTVPQQQPPVPQNYGQPAPHPLHNSTVQIDGVDFCNIPPGQQQWNVDPQFKNMEYHANFPAGYGFQPTYGQTPPPSYQTPPPSYQNMGGYHNQRPQSMPPMNYHNAGTNYVQQEPASEYVIPQGPINNIYANANPSGLRTRNNTTWNSLD